MLMEFCVGLVDCWLSIVGCGVLVVVLVVLSCERKWDLVGFVKQLVCLKILWFLCFLVLLGWVVVFCETIEWLILWFSVGCGWLVFGWLSAGWFLCWLCCWMFFFFSVGRVGWAGWSFFCCVL